MRWKKKSESVVVGSGFFQRNNNKNHTDDTQVSLGTTLPSLPWSSFRMTGWTFLLSVVFTLESWQQHWEHLTLALTFLQRDTSSVNWKQLIGATPTVNNLSFCNNSCSCPWPFHREKLSGWWQKNFLEVLGHKPKRWHLFTNKPGQESEKEDSTMAALIGAYMKR